MSIEHQKYSRVCMYPSLQNLLRVLTHYLPPGLALVLVMFFSGSLNMDHISLKTKQVGLRKRSTLSLRY